MMEWIEKYQCLLFDFDGLLVNTEELHYRAYQRMVEGRGFTLPWTFPRYCLEAHYSSTGLRDQVYKEFPELQSQEPDWTVLYAEKKAAYRALLEEGAVELMPGVAPLLEALKNSSVTRCVVTHSPEDVVGMIRGHLPYLEVIDNWMTRNDYSEPKPSPECYQKAIERHCKEGRVVGFEDSVRGMRALQGSRAEAVMICTSECTAMDTVEKEGLCHYESFTDIPANGPTP